MSNLESNEAVVLTKSTEIEIKLNAERAANGTGAGWAICCVCLGKKVMSDWVGLFVKGTNDRLCEDCAGKHDPSKVLQLNGWLDKKLNSDIGYEGEKEPVVVLTPIEQMTDAELEAKANEYFALAEAEFRHADEIERYIENRSRYEIASQEEIEMLQELGFYEEIPQRGN